MLDNNGASAKRLRFVYSAPIARGAEYMEHKPPIPTEAQEGKLLVAYLRTRGYRFTHIANETGSGRGARFQGIRNKQQGVSKGFPDYLVIVKDKLVFIELKRTKGGRVTPEQWEWIEALEKAGAYAEVCAGWEHARTFIEELA